MAPTKDTRAFVTGEIADAIEASSWRWKAMDVAVKVAMPILLAVSAWTFTQMRAQEQDIQKNKARIQLLEATTISRKEHEERREKQAAKDKALLAALSEIKIMLARFETKLESLDK